MGYLGTIGLWGLGKEVPEESSYNVSGSNGSYNISTGYRGANPLTPAILTPDIDVNSTFSISEDLDKGILSINANIKGDKFPSAEAFITDQSGNSVFIGVSSLSGDVLTSLWGKNYRNMIDASFNVTIDNQGTFTGVMVEDRSFTLDQWNKYFETQSPK
jgi:hypothetical protein